MKKLIGRVVHFVLSFGLTAGVLNAIYYQDPTMLNIASAFLLICITGIGFIWEFRAQQYIAKRFPKLKWDPKSDTTAFVMFLAGYATGIIFFGIIYMLQHV
jgi:hypothetical protein